MTDLKGELPSRPDLTIRGDVVLGTINPRILNEAEFSSSSGLLYHGAAKEFIFSPLGEYDLLNTGGDGTDDYGSGFYMTDDLNQARNYSLERSAHRLKEPIVYPFLPYQARMLDVRNLNNPQNNGILPRTFVENWASFLENFVDDAGNFSSYNEFLKDTIQGGIRELFLGRVKKALQEKKDIYIRSGRDVYSAGIFQSTSNGLIGHIFRKFMLSIGYDGTIYREGGEGEKGDNLTGYVFYNPRVVDTWEGWQKRKEE